MPTRPLTSSEIAKLRGSHHSELYLAIARYNTVYTARLTSAPPSHDEVAQITYTSGSGTLANVRSGMTLLVGTKSGGSDLGRCRIRKAPTTNIFYIGETSSIAWQANAHLTVIDEFDIWPRHPRIASGVVYMDYDVAYTNQHSSFHPIANMGPHAVVWLRQGSATVSFDARRSWVFGTATLSYSWSAPGAHSITGGSTAQPTIEYRAPGFYRVFCTVTAGGQSTTGVRYVFVYSDTHRPITAFNLTDCNGSYANGGWEFSVDMYDEAALSLVQDRALCILFARDHFNGVEDYVGVYSGRENIIAIGQIVGESISWSPDHSTVSFRVAGAQEFMRKIMMFPTGVEWSSNTASWTNIPFLTVDRALWHLLYWRSTLPLAYDFYRTGDTRYTLEASTMPASLWEQAETFAEQIGASCGVDQFGAFYAFVDTHLTPTGNRAAFPVIQTLARADWSRITIVREPATQLALVDLSGVSVSDQRKAAPLFSLAPGHVYHQFGNAEIKDRLLLSDQSSANALAGLYSGWKNNRYPEIEITLGNHRMCTLFPQQYYAITISQEDTEREFEYSGRLTPRSVSYSFEEGAITATIRCEAETFADLNTTGDMPPSETPPPPLPPLPPIPPYPTYSMGPRNVLVLLAEGGLWFTTNFHEEIPRWYSANINLPQYFLNNVCSVAIDGGALYLCTTFHNLGGTMVSGVYYAPSVGSALTCIIDRQWLLDRGYSGEYPYTPCVGRFANGVICLILGMSGVTGGARDIWLGNRTTWTKYSRLSNPATGIAHNIMTYCGGKLLLTHFTHPSTSYCARILSNGTEEWSMRLGYNLVHARCGRSQVVVFGGDGLGTNRAYMSLNNGGEGRVEDLIPITLPGNYSKHLACNGDGLYMLMGTPTTVFKTTDRGVTWVNTNCGFGAVTVLCLDSNQWIAAGGTIRYTPDFALTWFNKTSELAEAISAYGQILRVWTF